MLSAVKGFIGRMQFLVKERLGVEVDGVLKYQSRQDVLGEKTREDAIRVEGWDFVRIMGRICCIRAVRSRNYPQCKGIC